MTNMEHIEKLAESYAKQRGDLATILDELRQEKERIMGEYMPRIREAVARANGFKGKLQADIEAAPLLFDKPRTRTFSGIKVGFTKQKGKVVIDDEEATIKRIRGLLPKDQAELLIKVKESVHKPSVADLTVADLKRLGIRITDDTDAVVIKPTDSEVDKVVAALLDEAGEPDDVKEVA